MFDHGGANRWGGPRGTGEATADVRDRASKVACVEVALWSDDELCGAVVDVAAARAALDAHEAHVLAELEQRGTCDREFGLSTTSWVMHHTGMPRATVAARVKTATRLRILPEADTALGEGRIGFDHARALGEAVANSRIADQVIDLHDTLVDLATEIPYRQWRSELGRLVELLDQDGSYDPDEDLARNWVRLTPLGPDHFQLAGELYGETALTVSQALHAEADRQHRTFTRDGDQTDGVDTLIPRRPTLLALGLAELLRRGTATPATSSRAPVTDVTLALDARATDHADDWPADRVGPTRRTDDCAGERRSQRAARFTNLDGDPLPPDRYAHLLCDAGFHAVVLDSLGVPLDLGRTERLATPAQRRALTIRDCGCRFPGCDAPASWTDVHHIDEFQHGGCTDLHNLVLLCRHHHGVTHRQGWNLVPRPDGTLTWTTPSGRTLTSPPPRAQALEQQAA